MGLLLLVTAPCWCHHRASKGQSRGAEESRAAAATACPAPRGSLGRAGTLVGKRGLFFRGLINFSSPAF